MAQPQEKTPDRISDLPNPELNPMLNPTLGRNLGRWAQVYFTSPPEKREQAVVELLRELEAESGPGALQPESGPALIHEVPKTPIALESGVCGGCGHPSAPSQRFCGMCGSPLVFEDQSTRGRTEKFPLAPATFDTGPAEPLPEHNFPTLSLFAPSSRPSDGNGTFDVQWLRDKNLRQDHARAAPRNSAKYALAVGGVVLVGIFFYAQSRTQGTRPAGSRPLPAMTVTPENQPHSNPPQPSSTVPTVRPTSGSEFVAAKPAVSNPVSAPASSSFPAAIPSANAGAKEAPGDTGTLQPEPDAPTAANGSLELATAEEYLSGKNRPRDSAEAVRLLWLAVRKENATAVFLLSQMYLAGDGVTKNCDQARVLLTVAAQKHIPEAAEKLRDLKTSGCP